ncbi:MAG: hypothetical protein ABI305_00280 [Tepidiformaceae bacterium]
MTNKMVEQLGKVEVLTPEGESVALGSVWEGRTILLAMIRHFG